MDPNQPFNQQPQQDSNQSPQFFPAPGVGPQPNTPVIGQPMTPLKAKQSNKNKLIIIGAAASVLLLLIIVLVVALAGGKEPTVAPQQKLADDAAIQPATSIEVEAINNGISQDIGSLNDSEDFPPTKLDDKSLGL